jgi:hypothetical protein
VVQETILKQVMNEFGSQLTNVMQHNALLDLPEFKIDQRTEKVAESINSGTRRRNGGFGALLGGALGAVAGSFIPVAVALLRKFGVNTRWLVGW